MIDRTTSEERNGTAQGAEPGGAQPPPLLEVTPRALDEIRSYAARQPAGKRVVRLSLHPEERTEEKYALEFVARGDRRPEDTDLALEGVAFRIDARSAELLRGTRMDFVEGMWSSGFLFENPNRLRMMADPLAREVQAVLDRRVADLVGQHGGSVTLVDVREGKAYIEFGGGCQGCGKAPQTLRDGIIALVREAVPAIRDVVDQTDHAAGENPYFD